MALGPRTVNHLKRRMVVKEAALGLLVWVPLDQWEESMGHPGVYHPWYQAQFHHLIEASCHLICMDPDLAQVVFLPEVQEPASRWDFPLECQVALLDQDTHNVLIKECPNQVQEGDRHLLTDNKAGQDLMMEKTCVLSL